MAYLSLKNVGKIYVSESSVAVGIRGVTLDFELGEFVAVTGKSGSGKSTLLNVISGMDSYEEGEILIEGSPTSHYIERDWELFREKYISFVFQDYNIIESFTVLQNVELALLHIEDAKERRRRALTLLDRVGLSSHLKHKGSRLSGGQKQRVVIARALAKDSPILLADEPTGNLDSESAKEIVSLLHEISKEKLVIVVTHNFDQLEGYATRHIRVFDGAIERDLQLSPRRLESERYASHGKGRGSAKKDIAGGLLLGKSIFTARPRLSVFLCLLMILGTLALFVVTGFCGSAFDVFKPNYMFQPSDGRVILTSYDGSPLSDGELSTLAERFGASSFLHFDSLLDEQVSVFIPNDRWGEYLSLYLVRGEDFGEKIVGRYPEAANEVLLSLPLSYQLKFGKDEILTRYIEIDRTVYEVVGVYYEIDNNLESKCLLTDEGYRNASALRYLNSSGSISNALLVRDASGTLHRQYEGEFVPSYAISRDMLYIGKLDSVLKEFEGQTPSLGYEISVRYYRYLFGDSTELEFSEEFDESHITRNAPDISEYEELFDYGALANASTFISPYLLCDMVEKVLSESYRQASLFFESEERAEEVAALLVKDGYRAVTARATYQPDGLEVIGEVLGCLASLLLWVGFVIFLSFFITLCSSRALAAFKGDMAIMRSMGISVKVIRIAMYVRMLITLIPAFFLTVACAIGIYTSPVLNALFIYLYAWQYALIFVGMLILVYQVTRRQIAKLFSQSVKKALRGGDVQ